jgi:hypothetical protein
MNIVDKSDRTCQYCNKEFKYPYMFKKHKKTKCWIESTQINIESTKFNIDSTVPIRLSLV